jgi:hypothetical protein
LSHCAMPEDSAPGSLREAVLAGPGEPVALGHCQDVAELVIRPPALTGALAAAGHRDVRSRALTAAASAAAVLGLCLYSGEGQDSVLARIWPLTAPVRPGFGVGSPEVVTAPALSKARERLPVQVMESLFQASASMPDVETKGLRVFGMIATAFDGTVFDLHPDPQVSLRYATPSGGTCPQARVVTLIRCGTRRVLAAQIGSYAVSEQALWDRMVTTLQPGTINFCDRNFFSMDRWRRAAATGAHLVWRVKNGKKSLPAKVIRRLPDGSYLVRLHESDAMLAARRKAIGDPHAARLDDIVARLVEFDVVVTDEAGKKTPSHFRVLTTLTDHETFPARQVAQAYTERWQAELTYKSIKSTLRGTPRRLRGHTADLAQQEIWGLLTVYNALITLAVTTAVDLGIDPDEISFTVVLRATRDHLLAAANATHGCPNCGHRSTPDPQDLITAIAAGPRNRTDRHRTGPRTAKKRQTEHTHNVSYTINITETNLSITTISTQS